MITVEATEKEFQVTIPREIVDERSLDALLRWLEFDALARTSQMTEAQAGQLAEEIKADWWARNEHRFIPAEFRQG
jgi:hypothetical protein